MVAAAGYLNPKEQVTKNSIDKTTSHISRIVNRNGEEDTVNELG
jgi:hypothetical protein